MSWHFVERWLQKVNQHSTLIGKFWITFVIVFRIVVISSVGDRVYSDEQSEFKCNTLEVGCPNVCFNKFSPISHIRFWSFQIILVTAPSIAFIVYSAHKVKKKPTTKQKSFANGQSLSPNKTQNKHTYWQTKKPESSKEALSAGDDKRRNSKFRNASFNQAQEEVDIKQLVAKNLFGDDKAAFSQHYILYALSVITRTGIEIVFMYLQYTFFGFSIVELYKCRAEPCPNTVDCFVSRPMEKTIFLWFMFLITVLCLFLNFLELQYLFWKLCVRKRKLERKQKKLRYQSTFAVTNGENSEVLYQRPNSAVQLPTAPPNYGKVVNLPDFSNSQSGPNVPPAHINPIAMSFSMNDAVFPVEETAAQAKYNVVSLVSSPSTNNLLNVRGDQQDQTYMTSNPRADGIITRQKTYNNYV